MSPFFQVSTVRSVNQFGSFPSLISSTVDRNMIHHRVILENQLSVCLVIVTTVVVGIFVHSRFV